MFRSGRLHWPWDSKAVKESREQDIFLTGYVDLLLLGSIFMPTPKRESMSGTEPEISSLGQEYCRTRW